MPKAERWTLSLALGNVEDDGLQSWRERKPLFNISSPGFEFDLAFVRNSNRRMWCWPGNRKCSVENGQT